MASSYPECFLQILRNELAIKGFLTVYADYVGLLATVKCLGISELLLHDIDISFGGILFFPGAVTQALPYTRLRSNAIR